MKTILSIKLAAVLSALLLLGGCSSAIDSQGYTRDPWQPFNRAMFTFNDTVDTYVFKPIAKSYEFVFPRPVRSGVENFFGNLHDIGSLFNAIIQLDGKATAGIAARVIDNTFFGLGGLLDVATPMGNPKIKRNFGSTLARYGVKSGPYLVLPFFGPSDLRDGIGLIPDFFTYPASYISNDGVRWGMFGLDTVQTRASLLPVDKQLDGASPDKYATIRDAWLQHRWGELGQKVNTDDSPEVNALFAPAENK